MSRYDYGYLLGVIPLNVHATLSGYFLTYKFTKIENPQTK